MSSIFDSSLDTTTQITWVDHYGATTDGSLDKLYADVGNHEFNFTTAIKDSFLHLGAGWDVVNLIDHRDVPDTQYWAMIRRDDNALDAYSLADWPSDQDGRRLGESEWG